MIAFCLLSSRREETKLSCTKRLRYGISYLGTTHTMEEKDKKSLQGVDDDEDEFENKQIFIYSQ